MWRRLALLPLAVAAGCVLYSEVVIGPLLLDPERLSSRMTSNPRELLERGEFNRVIAVIGDVEKRPRVSARDLAALGSAELAAGRFEDGRRHLRRALDLKLTRAELAQVAWDLSQLEYLDGNYDAALEWATMADRNGLQVRRWHLDFLGALAKVDTYRIEGARSSRVRMNTKMPRIPRIDLRLPGNREVTGVIDSGAALSIISATLARQLNLPKLETVSGTFYGLLGEPINVSFAVLDSLQIGEMVIRSIPVAIMPDAKLDFVVLNREPFKMDLLLGANLLKEFRLEFDYGSSHVTFDALPRGGRIAAENQNLFFVGFRPFVHASINRRAWYPFLLDTGSEITFLNANRIDATPLVNLPKFHGATLQGLGGARKIGSKLENIDIGVDRWAGSFRNIALYSTEHSPAFGIVGQDFLRNFRVVLDFGSMRVELHRERSLFKNAAR